MSKQYPSRYDYGSKTIRHKNKKIRTSINTSFMDTFGDRVQEGNYNVGEVKSFIEHRPDTISNIFYSTTSFWWYVMLYNNINDPFERLNPSDNILIPNINDIF
tara:strand:+ start:900 stop:1208 length:309 start_codon:yes stop_codon:yes gene_type:complete